MIFCKVHNHEYLPSAGAEVKHSNNAYFGNKERSLRNGGGPRDFGRTCRWCAVYTVCSVAPLKSLKLPAISPGSRHFTMGGVEEKGEEDLFKSALPEVGREDGGPGSAGTQTQEKAAPCLVSAPSPQGRPGCHAETSLG